MTDSTRRRVGRRLWVGIPGSTLEVATAKHLQRLSPGGVVLFGRNGESRATVARLVVELRDLLGPALHIAVDQEGGRVVRFTEGATVFPGNAALGAVAQDDLAGAVELARRQGYCSGSELSELGVNVNLAPVVDLSRRAANPAVGDRSFGADAEIVAALTEAMVQGHRRAGVLVTLKHFPGLGDAVVDPHHDLPVVSEAIDRDTLQPFRTGIAAGAELVMTTHVRYESLEECPATMSQAVVKSLLRGELGFGGAVVSDALEMGALAKHFPLEETVRRTVAAGHDLLCFGTDEHEFHLRALEALCEAYDSGADCVVDAKQVDARLDRLHGTPPPVDGVHEEGPALAKEIASRAARVVQDPRGLIPLGEASTLLALPRIEARTLAEDPLRGESLETLRQGLGESVQVVEYAAEPTGDDFAAIARAAIDRDRLVLVLFDTRFSAARRRLADQAPEWQDNVVFVLLSDLHDVTALPLHKNPAVVCVHGFREVHQDAALRVLLSPH